MSLIVAIKKDDVVYLGADTRTTRGERVRSNLAREDLKIHKMGSCFVGAAGTVANLQLMISHPEWFELKGKPLTKKFIVQKIIPNYGMGEPLSAAGINAEKRRESRVALWSQGHRVGYGIIHPEMLGLCGTLTTFSAEAH